VIGNHARDIHLQLSYFPPMEEVGKAVIEFAGEEDNSWLDVDVGNAPIHLQVRGNWGEFTFKALDRIFGSGQIKTVAHEEGAAALVFILICFGDIGPLFGNQRRNAGKDANMVRATCDQSQTFGIRLH